MTLKQRNSTTNIIKRHIACIIEEIKDRNFKERKNKATFEALTHLTNDKDILKEAKDYFILGADAMNLYFAIKINDLLKEHKSELLHDKKYQIVFAN